MQSMTETESFGGLREEIAAWLDEATGAVLDDLVFADVVDEIFDSLSALQGAESAA